MEKVDNCEGAGHVNVFEGAHNSEGYTNREGV